jgi:hypothetical protein
VLLQFNADMYSVYKGERMSLNGTRDDTLNIFKNNTISITVTLRGQVEGRFQTCLVNNTALVLLVLIVIVALIFANKIVKSTEEI